MPEKYGWNLLVFVGTAPFRGHVVVMTQRKVWSSWLDTEGILMACPLIQIHVMYTQYKNYTHLPEIAEYMMFERPGNKFHPCFPDVKSMIALR